MTTGIVVALPEEISTLTKKKIGRGCFAAITNNILLAHAGSGPENAQSAARLLLDNGAQRLISWGCCAALEASMQPGDLTLPDRIVSEQAGLIAVHSAWHHFSVKLLAQYFPVHRVNLLESRTVIAAREDKKKLYLRTGCSVLDMESFAVANFAKQHGIPFLAIRAVADPAEMNLPAAVTFALNSQGEIELKKLLYYVLTHCSEIPALIKLGIHFKAAGDKLKLVARQVNNLTQVDHRSSTLELT